MTEENKTEIIKALHDYRDKVHSTLVTVDNIESILAPPPAEPGADEIFDTDSIIRKYANNHLIGDNDHKFHFLFVHDVRKAMIEYYALREAKLKEQNETLSKRIEYLTTNLANIHKMADSHSKEYEDPAKEDFNDIAVMSSLAIDDDFPFIFEVRD